MSTCSTTLKHPICLISKEYESKTTKGVRNPMLQQKLYQKRECTEFKQKSTWKCTVASQENHTIFRISSLALHGTCHLQNNPSPQKYVLTNASCLKFRMMQIRQSWGLGLGGARREIRTNIYQKRSLLSATPVLGTWDQKVKPD